MRSIAKQVLFSAAITAAIAIPAPSSEAALIASAGQISNSAQATDWRTASTPKTFDIDGNNIYGTLGAVHWTIVGVNQQAAASSTLGWAFLGSGSQFINAAYANIDQANAAPTDADAGIALTSFAFELTGTAADYLGKTVRVGVFQDVLGSTENAADVFKGLRLVQTVGGTGDSGIVSVRGGASGNGVPDLVFFDITGATPGNRFSLTALTNVGGTGVGQAGYVGPVFFDLATVVPEPATLSLLGASVLGLGLRRRRMA